MSMVTDNVARYIQEKGISVLNLAQKTGRSYAALNKSLGKSERKQRDLRDDELLDICAFLEINPMDFAPQKAV